MKKPGPAGLYSTAILPFTNKTRPDPDPGKIFSRDPGVPIPLFTVIPVSIPSPIGILIPVPQGSSPGSGKK
jgi:hypothetical protein